MYLYHFKNIYLKLTPRVTKAGWCKIVANALLMTMLTTVRWQKCK